MEKLANSPRFSLLAERLRRLEAVSTICMPNPMKTNPAHPKETNSGITFNDCVESVRYEIEDALARFPEHRSLFLHQVRIVLDKLEPVTQYSPMS